MSAPRAPLLLLLALTMSCRESAGAPITIELGPGPTDEATLVPRSSLAEYIEVSPSEAHLLLGFSSVERGCDAAPEPTDDMVGLSVRIVLTEGEHLAPGSFPLQRGAEPQKGSHATATVRLRSARRELLPGGSVELASLDLSPRGAVEGALKLEFPGDQAAPATRVSGLFTAYFCRINRLR